MFYLSPVEVVHASGLLTDVAITIRRAARAEYSIDFITQTGPPGPQEPGPGDKCMVPSFPSLFRKLLPPQEVISMWRRHIADVVPQDMLGRCVSIVQTMQDALLSIQTQHSWRFAEMASRVKFNTTISKLADQVAESMREKDKYHAGGPGFTGVHLRIEDDAAAFFEGDPFNSRDNMLRHYKEVVYNFDASQTVYIAGAHGEDDEAEMASLLERKIVTKRKVLEPALLANLDSEQLALIDFLVLSKAQYFVGLAASSMSYFCKEYRVLQGRPRLTSYLLDIQRDRYKFREAMTLSHKL